VSLAVRNAKLAVLLFQARDRDEHRALVAHAERRLDGYPHRMPLAVHRVDVLHLADRHLFLIADLLARQAADVFYWSADLSLPSLVMCFSYPFRRRAMPRSARLRMRSCAGRL
jgi:hypothetical protein